MMRLAVAYIRGLAFAFACVAGLSTALYALDIPGYRILGFIGGPAEANYGEFHGRLLLGLGLGFIPLSLFAGLPLFYRLCRHRRRDLEGFIVLGAGLGAVAAPVMVSLGNLYWFPYGPLSGVVWALTLRRVARYELTEAEGVPTGEVAHGTRAELRWSWLVHVAPALFAASLCLPALLVRENPEGPGTLGLYGIQVLVFTFFMTATNGWELAACLLGVSANLMFCAGYLGFWVCRIARCSSWRPFDLALAGTACALLSPIPVYGHRVESLHSGYLVWLCAHFILAAVLYKARRADVSGTACGSQHGG